MNPNPGLDRQDFEAFLANAFAVQKSGLDAQSLSAIVEIQKYIGTAQPDVERALDLIADCSLKVSNASGVAIARLESNQLIYCVGKGSAVNEVGRRLPAVFSLCTQSEGKAEILRVENAETDSRIQAEVCRQFGAASLLILPICHHHLISGILQVHFSEAHSFLDREVRAYRLLAGLAADAISTTREHTEDVPPVTLAGTAAVVQGYISNSNAVNANDMRLFQDVLAPSGSNMMLEWRRLAEIAVASAKQWAQVARRVVANHVWESQTVSAAILLAVLLAIPHFHRPALQTLDSTASASSTDEKLPDSPASVSYHSTRFSHEKRDEMAPNTSFRKVRVGPNEVDYIAKDVTIRHFTSNQPKPQGKVKLVNIGDDVTVRYFSSDSTGSSQAIPSSASTK
jgi:hypothetical protein